jgi:negative regulator of genetic competence, sporulation and motility
MRREIVLKFPEIFEKFRNHPTTTSMKTLLYHCNLTYYLSVLFLLLENHRLFLFTRLCVLFGTTSFV